MQYSFDVWLWINKKSEKNILGNFFCAAKAIISRLKRFEAEKKEVD